jgi:LPXTG-site transpeptidase (sortase) family protein
VVQAGSITNTAQVMLSDQTDPDSMPGNNDPAEDDQASVTMGGIFDPPSAIKTINAAGLPELEFRMVWINSGNAFAIDVQVVDQIPTGTVYVPGSLTCDPRGSSTNAAVATSPLSLAAVPSSFCGYDSVANRIQWQGNIGPDNSHLTEATADNEVVITFRVTVNNAVNQVRNQGFSRTDVDADANFDEETVLGSSLVSSNQVIWNRNTSGSGSGDPDDDGGGIVFPGLLPATGFAPNVITTLPDQSTQKRYADTDTWVEIPSLGINIPIVGVPLVDGDWDLSWLDKQAGWLNGTAFPSWKGNSALTGHVYLPNGKPGPFVGLGKLKWGDKIIVHAYGSAYTYEVRENRIISPNNTSILKHEDDAWLTLITCKTYNEASNSYADRIAVRATLVNVQTDKLPGIPKNGR